MNRSCARALAAAALVVAACRRAPAPPPAAAASRPVIFVGLDGADWQMLDPLIAEGRMPQLAGLVREGRAGVLVTQQPPLSPLVWTTMMTGVSPLEHGILDFTRFSPASHAREPITSDERRVPAVWTMATEQQRRVAVLGLWATYPAEPVNGLMVSDRLFSFQRQETSPPGVVFPAGREAAARAEVAAQEDAVGVGALREYLPWLDEAEWSRLHARPDPWSHPVTALRRILVETRVYDALARRALADDRPDLAVVYFQGTDAIGHVFAPYGAPRQPSVSEEDFRRYAGVAPRYFADVDTRLGAYREAARAGGALLVIASDHGFRWSEGRPQALSSLAAPTAGRWHRDEGIYVVWDPTAPASGGTHAGRGSVDQVCATLLAGLGLPRAKGVAEPALAGLAEGAAVIDYAAQPWRPASPAPATALAPEQVEQLRALGYVGAAEPARAAAVTDAPTRTAGSYNNEGLIQRGRGRTAEARTAFEHALAVDPASPSAEWNLSELLLAGGDRERADRLLVQAIAHRLPDGSAQAAARAARYGREGDTARALALTGAALDVAPKAPELRLLRARWRLAAHDCAGALADLTATEPAAPRDPSVPAALGLAYLCLDRPAEARRALERSLALEPDQPQVRATLSQLR